MVLNTDLGLTLQKDQAWPKVLFSEQWENQKNDQRKKSFYSTAEI